MSFAGKNAVMTNNAWEIGGVSASHAVQIGRAEEQA